MTEHIGEWEILGIRQLAAVDERAEEFSGTLLVHRRGGAEPVEAMAVTAKRAVLAELEGYLTRLLRRSRGLAG
ncbi:MAG TPA: hypothetical protein VGW35_22410 [Methylomirabilota bacterium]|jgi:hypothetical protein|nr:hypothetical protein [Methylomirabilota bacterium]